MHHGRFLAAALLSISPITVIAAPTGLSSRDSSLPRIKTQRVVQSDFADPGVFKSGDTWYAFATNNGKVNVQVATSDDFETWTVKSNWDALPKAGSWAQNPETVPDTSNMKERIGSFVSTGRWSWSNAAPQVWAPDVIQNDLGMHVLFYSAQQKDAKRHCIGAAISLSPDGPYLPFEEAFACHEDEGGVIDPSSFKDPVDGKRYVVYKVDGNNIGHGGICGNTVEPIVPTPIMLQEVGPDGYTKIGDPVQILDRDASDGPLIEAPNLTRTENGTYMLFFSSNCYSTEWYDVAYAFADNITGPYTKSGPFAVSDSTGLYSPGGATIASDGTHMVFHAGNNGKGGRSMYTTKISFSTDSNKNMKVLA